MCDAKLSLMGIDYEWKMCFPSIWSTQDTLIDYDLNHIIPNTRDQ